MSVSRCQSTIFKNKKKTRAWRKSLLQHLAALNCGMKVMRWGQLRPCEVLWWLILPVPCVIRAQPEQGGDPASPLYRLRHVRHSGCGWPKCCLVGLWSCGSFLVVLNNSITTNNGNNNKAGSPLPGIPSWILLYTAWNSMMNHTETRVKVSYDQCTYMSSRVHTVFQRRQATDYIQCNTNRTFSFLPFWLDNIA